MRAKTVGGSSIRRLPGVACRRLVGGVAPGAGRRRPVDVSCRATAGDTGRRARVSRRPKPQRRQRSARDRQRLPSGRAGVDVAARRVQGAGAARATGVGGLTDIPSTVRAARRGRRDDRRRAGPEDRPRADECVHPHRHGPRSGAGGHDAASCLETRVSGARDRTRPGAGRRRRPPPVGEGRGGGRKRDASRVFETARAIAIGRVVAREVAQWGVDR